MLDFLESEIVLAPHPTPPTKNPQVRFSLPAADSNSLGKTHPGQNGGLPKPDPRVRAPLDASFRSDPARRGFLTLAPVTSPATSPLESDSTSKIVSLPGVAEFAGQARLSVPKTLLFPQR